MTSVGQRVASQAGGPASIKHSRERNRPTLLEHQGAGQGVEGGVQAGARGLARCSRRPARAVLADPVPGGPLTQFASERIWAPARGEAVSDGRWWRRQRPPPQHPLPRAPVRLRSRQSRRRLRRSTRSQSGPRPRPAPRSPPPTPTPIPDPVPDPRTRSGDSAC